LPIRFVTSFRATLISGASQSELSIKVMGVWSFFALNFLNPIQCKNSTIKYTLNQVVDKTIWVKSRFLTIFNEFYKIVNLLQREAARDVKPSFHNGRERLMHQVTKLNRDNRRACARQMNHSKTSEHHDTNENQWEEKAASRETNFTTRNREYNGWNQVNEVNEGTWNNFEHINGIVKEKNQQSAWKWKWRRQTVRRNSGWNVKIKDITLVTTQ